MNLNSRKDKKTKNMETDIRTLKNKIPKLDDLYSISSKLFYLPDRTSRAISAQWLLDLNRDSSKIWCPPASCTRHHYKCQGRGAASLLIRLEKLIKEKKGSTKSTGFTSKQIPNINWIKDSLIHLWNGKDEMGLLLDTSLNFNYNDSERYQLESEGSVKLSTE